MYVKVYGTIRVFKEEKRIVGRQPKGQVDKEILGIETKLTTEQKV